MDKQKSSDNEWEDRQLGMQRWHRIDPELLEFLSETCSRKFFPGSNKTASTIARATKGNRML
jgi:hypothetical protein